jgi:hypothetical protein
MSHRARQAAGNSPRPTHALLVGRGGRSSHTIRHARTPRVPHSEQGSDQLVPEVGDQVCGREPHEAPLHRGRRQRLLRPVVRPPHDQTVNG